MVVSVGRVPENGRPVVLIGVRVCLWIPTQPRGNGSDFAAGLFAAGVPRSEDVTVGTLDNRWDVVMVGENRSVGFRLHADEYPRSAEIRVLRVRFAATRKRDLCDVATIQWHGRRCRGCRCRNFRNGDAEADKPRSVIRHRSHPIRRAEIIRFGGVTTAACHAETPVGRTHRISLIALFIRPIPVAAPLLDETVDITESPRIRRCSSNIQRDNVALGFCPLRVGEP